MSVNDVSPFQGGRRPQTFQVNLAGPDLNTLSKYAGQLIAELKKEQGLVNLDTTLSLRKPEVQVIVDREAASDLGVPVGTIADSLRVLVGGLPVSKFRDGDQQYDVWLRAQSGDRGTNQDLYQITFPSISGEPVKLDSIAKLVEDRGPTEIERLGRERIVTVLGNPEGIALGDAVSRAEKILKGMNLPPQYSYIFTGQAKTLGETGYYFLIAFTLSILFMYLILAAQFESWMQPIAILMALPVTIPFGMLSLVLFRTPMDLYAMFGLFMLVGIVKKNGILQVDATNQLRAKGRSRREAILEANHTRLRPILMTTVMLVAAMVPIALGQGPGAGAGQHGQGDHRRPDPVFGPGATGDSRVLFAPRHDDQPRATAGHPLLGRGVPEGRDSSSSLADVERRTHRERSGNQDRRALRLNRLDGSPAFSGAVSVSWAMDRDGNNLPNCSARVS